VEVGQLRGAAHEVLVEPLELLHLVDEAVDEALVQLAQVDALLALLHVLALAVQELGDLAREGVHVDRLLDVTVAARHQRALPVPLHGVRRHRDDGRGGEGGERLDDRHHLVAVHRRQVDVEQDQRRLLADGRLDARQPVVGVDDRVALRLEDGADQHPVLRIVLHVEDLGSTAVLANR